MKTTKDNPFACPHLGPGVQTVAAAERVAMVRNFDAAQCEAATHVAGLQQTVRQAIERRLRHIDKQRKKDES